MGNGNGIIDPAALRAIGAATCCAAAIAAVGAGAASALSAAGSYPCWAVLLSLHLLPMPLPLLLRLSELVGGLSVGVGVGVDGRAPHDQAAGSPALQPGFRTAS